MAVTTAAARTAGTADSSTFPQTRVAGWPRGRRRPFKPGRLARVQRLARIVAVAGLLATGGCATGTASAPRAAPSAAISPTESPNSSPTPAPTQPLVTPRPPPSTTGEPATILVVFAGLPPGLYPVHLHSICNGGQAFHLGFLSNLAIGGGGSGGINVPSGDAGRGDCVIVYADESLGRVLTTRPI